MDFYDFFVLSELDALDEKWKQGLCPRCASLDTGAIEEERFMCSVFGWKDRVEKRCAHFRHR